MNMPDKIYVDVSGRFFFGNTDKLNDQELKQTQYVRTDLAQSLADALEIATDQLEKAVSGDRIDTKAVNQILERSALANYRKGE